MKKEREYRFYLEDMLSSMNKIGEYIKDLDYLGFVQSHLITDAVIRNLEIIGEASNKLPQVFKSKHPEIPWSNMYKLRNIVSHEYFGVDYEIIWEIIKFELPENKRQLEKLL